MKKRYLAAVIIFILLFLVIYNVNKGSNNIFQDEVTYNLNEFIPNEEMLKEFSGGFENAGYIQIIDAINTDRFQIKSIDTATQMVNVYQVSKDSLKIIYSEEVTNEFKGSYLVVEPNKEETVLKEPIKVGTKWTGSSNKTYEITGVNVDVSTPAGNFTTIEVTETTDTLTIKNYYAKDIGLVKKIINGYGEDNLLAIEYLYKSN